MAWKSIDPWLKGWTIGFLIGLTQPVFFFIELAKGVKLPYLLFPTKITMWIASSFSQCINCSNREVFFVFLIPLIYGMLGIYIGVILYGMKGTIPPGSPIKYVKEKYF